MQIAGIQKMTLVDFPGHVAATVFTRGCSFRCGFCHNPELVLPEQFNPLLEERQIFDFFESRFGKLTGVCLTGGEPLLQTDADQFISHVKALGFDVKLDTNGSFPDRLEKIIKDGDVDYIAMDIKSPLSKYAATVFGEKYLGSDNQMLNTKYQILNTKKGDMDENGTSNLAERVQRSIKLIMSSSIDYEFRTTVCHPLHEVFDFEEIGQLIQGAKRYFIQQFVKSKQLNSTVEYKPFTDSEIAEVKNIMTRFVKYVELR